MATESESKSAGEGIADVLSPEDAREVLAREPDDEEASRVARVLDLRDAEEFTEGHIVGAVNAPDADADSLPEELPEDEHVIVVCEDGGRSSELAAKLRENGREASSIEGGMEAWRSEKLAQQPSTDFEEEPKKPPKLPGAGV